MTDPILEIDYKDIQEEFGALPQGESINHAELEESRSILPDHWVKTLNGHGRFSYRSGLVHVCGPNDLKSILSLVFKADKNFSHTNCIGVSYSAFGEIFFWHKDLGDGTIDLINGIITVDALTDPSCTEKIDRLILTSIDQIFENYDKDGKPLFSRARKKLGELKWGEVYGFTPAIALGGERILENLKVQPAIAHFAMLAQLQPFYLLDIRGPNPDQQVRVREIG